MSENRIFQLESEIEVLKYKRQALSVPSSPIFPFLVMAAGVTLAALGHDSLGYTLGALGFFGMLVIVVMKNTMTRRIRGIEEQIWTATTELEELRRH